MADTRRVNRLLKWLDKQRLSHLDMVTDAGDSSMWCKEEAELIRDHMKTVETMRREIDELARLRGFAEFVTIWAMSFRTSDRDDTVWTTDQWRELRRQIAAFTQPPGDRP